VAGAGGAKYGNVWIMQATPVTQGELESIREQILPEEIRFNQILEENNTKLIRSGIAKKITDLKMFSVDERTTFQAVRFDTGRFPEGIEPIQVEVSVIDRLGFIATIGSRPNKESGGAEMLPEEGFSEEEIVLVAGMIDELDLARSTGELPHLADSLWRLVVACPSYIAYEKANSQAPS